MGGKNKGKRRSHTNHNNASTNNYVSKLSEQDLCDLVTQASQMHVLLNERHEKLKKSENFVYILSTKWLKEWKQYVGYDHLFSDEKQQSKKTGKKKPGPPNADLTKTSRQYLQIPQQLQQYAYLNTIIKDKMSINDDYISITEDIWQQFNTIYGPGTQIKRPCRITKSKTLYVDGSLHKLDFLFVNYGMEDFQNKIQHTKLNKAGYEQIIPSYQIHLASIWQIDDLMKFLERLCLVKYNNQKITLWLADNFIGTNSLQQMFVKSAKSQTYQMYARKIIDEDYQGLDIEDFLKQNQYTLIIQIGDSRIVRLEPEQPEGYCQECLQKRKLKYQCKCQTKYYCSKSCQVDDQVYHFHICKQAFCNIDDQQYDKKKIVQASEHSKCGLKNLGNTCYMNSSLQMFLGLKFLVDFLTTNKYKTSISDKQKHGKMFLQNVSKTCKQMGEQTEMKYIQPWDIKSQINYFMPPFKGYKQHDAIDFFMGFLNTVNDCIDKPQGQAYSNLIKNNILGQFDSLVICPECNNQVKNYQCFTQLTLPIKGKTKKDLFAYVLFDNPTTCKNGKAQLRQSWQQIRSDIGVDQHCLIFGGAESQNGFSIIDMDIGIKSSLSKYINKFNKQILFYPYEKVGIHQFVVSGNFITTKNISGQNLRATYGYSFPIVIDRDHTTGHFFISLIRRLNLDQNKQLIAELQQKYKKIDKNKKQLQNKRKQKAKNNQKIQQSQASTQAQSKNSSNKKQKNSKSQQKSQKLQQNQQDAHIQTQLIGLNEQLSIIMQQLGLKIFIEDTKKAKNICFFCKRRCDGCHYQPDFRVSVQDSLAIKSDQFRIYVNITPKLQITKVREDLASSGDATIKDCLTLFGQPQKLDEQNAWYCPQCDNMTLALKQLHISKYPRYLILQLSRFKSGANGKIKNNQPVSYNQYEIFNGQKYRLLSVIVHEGSIENGHYWAICRRDNQFYIFNDEKVSKTDKICNKNAYILCYDKQQVQKQQNADQQCIMQEVEKKQKSKKYKLKKQSKNQ